MAAPILSAVIKVARTVVLYHVYTERQIEIRNITREKGTREADARQFGTTTYVRATPSSERKKGRPTSAVISISGGTTKLAKDSSSRTDSWPDSKFLSGDTGPDAERLEDDREIHHASFL
ncbi:hypothetical protein GGI42DRAFT_365770 [Trichoderma sp. SZMC 28013]